MKTLQEKKNYLAGSVADRIASDKTLSWMKYALLFLSIHGSTSYGLNTEESDVDMTGVCIPPKQYWFGYTDTFEQAQFNKPDGQIYGIKKFFALASANNPNVMELLWIDPKYWVYSNNIWDKLVENRDLFLSKKVRYTYSGYAISQLNRIKTHKKWLLNPPTHRPTREEFGLPVERIMKRDQQGALVTLVERGLVDLTDNFIERLQKENAYDRAVQEYEQYETWKKNRNPKRAELEAKFGYDVKHASQLVRLIFQAKNILLNGTLNVELPKIFRDEVMEVKRGGWSYDALMAWADDFTGDSSTLDAWAESSTLPKTPNHKMLNQLMIEIVEEWL